MPFVVVTSRHRPHELVLLGLSVLLGIAYLVRLPPPQTLAAVVPGWLVAVWALGLVVSGVIGLSAAVWQGSIIVALQMERAALLLNNAPLILIGGASFATLGWGRAVFGGSIILGLAAANLVRSLQINRDVKQLAAAMESGGR